jgi:hypothetical protein
LELKTISDQTSITNVEIITGPTDYSSSTSATTSPSVPRAIYSPPSSTPSSPPPVHPRRPFMAPHTPSASPLLGRHDSSSSSSSTAPTSPSMNEARANMVQSLKEKLANRMSRKY